MPLNALKIADLQARKVGGGVFHAAGIHKNSQDSTLAQNQPWNVKKKDNKKNKKFPFKLENIQLYNARRCELVDRLFISDLGVMHF